MDAASAVQVVQAIGVVLAAIASALAVVIPAYMSLAAKVARTQRALNDVGAKVDAQGRALAAGGATPPRQAPVWNQLDDPLPDGSQAPQRWNECGEECCAMEISRQHGVPLSADALRALLGGPGRAALTSAQDLVRCLALCNVPAQALEIAAADVAGTLQALTASGGTAICLGTWVSPHVLHWILVTRADANGCSANDPWGGRRRTWPWGAFRSVYAGELVTSRRTPDAL